MFAFLVLVVWWGRSTANNRKGETGGSFQVIRRLDNSEFSPDWLGLPRWSGWNKMQFCWSKGEGGGLAQRGAQGDTVSVFCLEGWTWTIDRAENSLQFSDAPCWWESCSYLPELKKQKKPALPCCCLRWMSCCSLQQSSRQGGSAWGTWGLYVHRDGSCGDQIPGRNACRCLSPDKAKWHLPQCSRKKCRPTQASACTIANATFFFSSYWVFPDILLLSNKSLHF